MFFLEKNVAQAHICGWTVLTMLLLRKNMDSCLVIISKVKLIKRRTLPVMAGVDDDVVVVLYITSVTLKRNI